MVLTHGDKRIVQSNSWKEKFYAEDKHEEYVSFLEKRGVTVFAMTFMLHCLLTHLHVFSKKSGSVEPEVKVFTTQNYDGKKALKELSLWLLSLGQDCDCTNYTNSSAESASRDFVHHGGGCLIRVPGIGLSQLDPRNQEVLMFAHTYLKEKFSNRKLLHAHELTHPGGSHGRKPTQFLVDPVYLGGWPQPRSNAWDEDIEARTDGKKDERIEVAV